MALIDITVAEPHGSDLVHVRGTVDDVPVEVYLKRADLLAQAAGQRRRYVASVLRDTAKAPPVNAFAALVGQETL